MFLDVYDLNVPKDYQNQEAPLVVNVPAVLILIATLALLILVSHYHV